METFYLSSLDYKNLEQIRCCRIQKIMKYLLFRHAALVKLDIPVKYNNKNYSEVVLISRHKGYDVKKINEFPFFVFVCVLKYKINENDKKIFPQDLENIGWGELYQSKEEAEKKY